MATNALTDFNLDDKPSKDEISVWQNMFGYSYSEANEHINNQRSSFSQPKVSDDHWELVRMEKEAQGYTREAYDHWIATGTRSCISEAHNEPNSAASSYNKSSYLVLLEGILSTPLILQEAADLPDLSKVIEASSKTGDVFFCTVDGAAKHCIEAWLSEQDSTFKLTFVRISKAQKNLSADSIHPTLGLESTLPQHRFSTDPTIATALPQHRNV